MTRPPELEDVPCPACGGPSVPSEKQMHQGDRPAGQLSCLSCGVTWQGTQEERARARRADRMWERRLFGGGP